jgi:hypothetical protein
LLTCSTVARGRTPDSPAKRRRLAALRLIARELGQESGTAESSSGEVRLLTQSGTGATTTAKRRSQHAYEGNSSLGKASIADASLKTTCGVKGPVCSLGSRGFRRARTRPGSALGESPSRIHPPNPDTNGSVRSMRLKACRCWCTECWSYSPSCIRERQQPPGPRCRQRRRQACRRLQTMFPRLRARSRAYLLRVA